MAAYKPAADDVHKPPHPQDIFCFLECEQKDDDSAAVLCYDLLSIVQLVTLCQATSFYQLVVNAAWLDGIYKVQHWQAGADLFVL